ncbi:putative transporter [Escovopsis weberi]|uniref:Putative transporter n=1 Tax=Escovopsis weberi TaxID=150374 RepID=A0A0M8N5H2_ESCWE|nr:putative transporter [Escovopsis weberi]
MHGQSVGPSRRRIINIIVNIVNITTIIVITIIIERNRNSGPTKTKNTETKTKNKTHNKSKTDITIIIVIVSVSVIVIVIVTIIIEEENENKEEEGQDDNRTRPEEQCPPPHPCRRLFAPSAAAGDMEMKPIAGHRRRKSSTIGPLGLSGVGPGRPMSQGASRRQHHPDNSPHPPDHALAAHAAKSHSPSPGSGSASGKEESGADSFSDDDLRDDEETGLTNKERARRQKRKQRNTQLGQRVAREKSLSAAERKEANKDVIKRALMNGLLILLWYFFSLSISLYNKWMFDSERLNFAFPLFTTSMHMLVQFGLAALVLYLFPSLRPAHGHTSDMGRSRHETETNSSGMTKLFYITRVGPCGAATGLDIGLGNTSLKFISLTFYTMCKSSSLAFVLLFAFVFRLEKPTWRLVGIIATMTMGVILMVSGEIEFKFGGFVLVISAAAFSGFRWSLTQILLLRNPTTSNPFSSIFFLTPVMFVTIILIAVPVEGFGSFCAGFRALSDEWGAVMAPLFLLFPGCIAFLMTASEFALLKRTSVVTLSIAGIFKEVVTISAASLVFKDKLTLVNFVGLVTTMVAIVAYNYIKIKKMREEARGRAVDADHPPLSSSASDVDDSNEEAAGLLSDNIEMSETPMAPTRSQARTSTSYVKHEDEH